MDELDDIARRSSASVNAEASRIAGTEDALRDLHSGAPSASMPPARWRPITIAAAVVAGLAVGAIVLLNRDDSRHIIATVPTDTETPTTAEPTTSVSEPTSTTSVATTATSAPAPSTFRVDLKHGLRVNGLASTPIRVNHVDAIDTTQPDGRAEYIATMGFNDGSILRFVLGHDTTMYPQRRPTTIAGDEGWIAGGTGEVAFAAGRKLDDDTWVRVESLLTWNPDTSTYTGHAVEGDVTALQSILAATTYAGPGGDDRVRSMVTGFPQPSDFCATEPAVSGGGPDMVLAMCDGTLAIYSGATGEQIELIKQFDDPRGAAPVEGPGPETVEGIGVSPDGSIVYFTTGPEPAVGNLFRYVRGSGVEPELIGYGAGPSVSPDGQFVATVAVDGLLVRSTADLSSTSYAMSPMYPQMPLHWSADSRRIAFGAGGGAIGVLDTVTGDVELYASDEPGRSYVEAWFDIDGNLMASSFCCDAQSPAHEIVRVGTPGNQPHSDAAPDAATEPVSVLQTSSGDVVYLANGVLGRADAPWATGVLAAALVPS